MAEPRERPILFSGPMMRALLKGRKTQTRRVVSTRLLDLFGEPSEWESQHYSTWRAWCHQTNQKEHFVSPFGVPGDRLWVRETWLEADAPLRPDGRGKVIYAADYSDDNRPTVRWRPSIHMPRWASRLTLEVVSVRAERLQEITQADALAEGVVDTSGAWGEGLTDTSRAGPRGAFEALWESINGPESWDANPWVWVGGFAVPEVRAR